MKWAPYVHGAQKVNPRDFGDPFPFPPVPLAVQCFNLSHEISYFTSRLRAFLLLSV